MAKKKSAMYLLIQKNKVTEVTEVNAHTAVCANSVANWVVAETSEATCT